MKKEFTFFVLFIAVLFLPEVHAQQFSQINTGTIANAVKSSRGCSWADYNNDGFPDLFVTNTNANNQLFKNNGDGTFQEITTGAIVNTSGISYAAIWGDYDNDGNLDVFVSNNPGQNSPPQLNFLYRNEGAPNFNFSSVQTPPTQNNANYTWSSSWVDYDNDGDLDLHTPDNKHLRTDFFYKNNGDGTFTSITPSFVTPNVESTGVVSWIDYDHDGDQDLFMIKSGRSHPTADGEDNRMYHNLLNETGSVDFQRVTTSPMVTHFDLDFQASWADYDNDGDMDVYLGNFDNKNYLYRNEGDSLFTKITMGAPVNDITSTLGSTWGDFDNDGDEDLYVLNTNGAHCKYYRNDGNGNFTTENITNIGAPISNTSAVQGAANADFNNDGYLDIYVTNSNNSKNYFYQNNGGDNNFVAISLHGQASNSAAFGTKVWVKSIINGNAVWQLRHLTGSPTGNVAQNDLRLHFGLGDAGIIDSLIIEWPLGARGVYTAIDANQFLEYTESETTAIENTVASTIDLLSVFPNPISTATTIQYEIRENSQNIRLSILNSTQKVVRVLFEGQQQKGKHSLRVDTKDWAEAIYYLVLDNGISKITEKLVLMNKR